jgi:hypothetical protein
MCYQGHGRPPLPCSLLARTEAREAAFQAVTADGRIGVAAERAVKRGWMRGYERLRVKSKDLNNQHPLPGACKGRGIEVG